MQEKYKKIFFHLVWLFIIGAIFGFIFETIWHFIKNGVYINKQGLWYGPLKPIYGCGVLLITLFLYKLKDKNPVWLFLGGFIIGTLFEYFASYFQEYVFGTYTWTYSGFNLNLNGRIYLPYCAAWGAISFVWIKYAWPLYLKLFNKLYSKRFVILSSIIAIFLVYDIALTTVITIRYSDRANNIEPQNSLIEYIDQKYPNDLIQEKFPKLRIITK